MRYLAMSVFLAVSFVPDRPGREAPAKPDLEQLQGAWEVVAFETSDGKLTPDQLKNYAKLVIKGNQYTWSPGGGGTLKIDPDKKPKTVDYSTGPGNGQMREAIYEIDGNTFRDCIAAPGKPRPTEFATPPGSGNILLVYRRVP